MRWFIACACSRLVPYFFARFSAVEPSRAAGASGSSSNERKVTVTSSACSNCSSAARSGACRRRTTDTRCPTRSRRSRQVLPVARSTTPSVSGRRVRSAPAAVRAQPPWSRPSRVRHRRQREAHLSDGARMVVDRARRTVAGGPPAGSQETSMTKHPEFKRRVRARMAKTGESYAAARAHLVAERPQPAGAALHLTNGDSTVPGLLGTGLAETVLPWRDVLHEGPVPDVPDAELRRIRARFLAGAAAADIGTEAEFERRDRALAEHRDGEFVLWFEADLYDQLQVVADPRRAARARRGCGARHADLHRRAPGLRALRRPRRAELRAARPAAGHGRHDAHAGGARARRARVGGAARPRPAPAWARSRPTRRPSCASWPRRSTASAASTRRPATGSRSPSGACSPPSPRARATRARRSCARRRASRDRSSGTRGASTA